MPETTNIKEQAFPSISLAAFLLRILASIMGGVVGALILVLFYVLAGTILTPILTNSSETASGSIFIFLLLIMVFLSTMIGNIVATLLISFTEREKYRRTSTSIVQIAVLSIIIFVFMVPIYFITSTYDIKLIAYAVALHMILTVQLSALILEIVSNYKYSLVGLYGTTLSIIVSAAVLFGLANIIGNPAILLFIALPIIWGSIGLISGLTTMVYGGLARIYDKDFLSTQTMYGEDYGKEVEVEEIIEEPIKDEEGADFLRRS